MALFTPWPPDAGSAASYSRGLAEALSDHAEVDVFVAGGDLDAYDRTLAPRVRLWSAGDFDWVHELRDFDRFLYVLGDSADYLHSFRALMERPGAVLAHDVRFGRIYQAVESLDAMGNHMWLPEKLFEMYGERIPLGVLRTSSPGQGRRDAVRRADEPGGPGARRADAGAFPLRAKTCSEWTRSRAPRVPRSRSSAAASRL